jgi:hypothetical protein
MEELMAFKRTAKTAYRSSRAGARDRGVEWLFTFERWVYWWEEQLGFDWLQKRGPTKYQYVMARKGDKGPYVEWNVDCVLSGVNSAHVTQTKRVGIRKQRIGKLTDEQVIEIFHSKESKWVLAEKYGIVSSVIYRIRTGRAWQHLTGKWYEG